MSFKPKKFVHFARFLCRLLVIGTMANSKKLIQTEFNNFALFSDIVMNFTNTFFDFYEHRKGKYLDQSFTLLA